MRLKAESWSANVQLRRVDISCSHYPICLFWAKRWTSVSQLNRYNSKYRYGSGKKQIQGVICMQSFSRQKRNTRAEAKHTAITNTNYIFYKMFLQRNFTMVFLIMVVRQTVRMWVSFDTDKIPSLFMASTVSGPCNVYYTDWHKQNVIKNSVVVLPPSCLFLWHDTWSLS